MTQTILNEHNELFEKVKENYEQKNFDKSLELAQELIKKNISSEYLYQIIISIYFNNKDYENAIKFSEIAINKYGGEINDENLLKIMKKIIDNPDYDISKDYFKTHIIKMLNNNSSKSNELLQIYINNELNNIENYYEFKKLYQNNKINRELFIDTVFYMIFYKHIFNETNESLLEIFIKDELGITQINDDIVFDKICCLKNNMIFIICLFYLTFPKILNLSNDQTLTNYNRIIQNINKLLKTCEYKIESSIILYTSLPIYYFYYLVYAGFNNKILYQQVSALFKKICPDITYKSKNVENKINIDNKIKIGFVSNLLFQNHSVCKDRIGIIKSLIDFDFFMDELIKSIFTYCSIILLDNELVNPLPTS